MLRLIGFVFCCYSYYFPAFLFYSIVLYQFSYNTFQNLGNIDASIEFCFKNWPMKNRIDVFILTHENIVVWIIRPYVSTHEMRESEFVHLWK